MQDCVTGLLYQHLIVHEWDSAAGTLDFYDQRFIVFANPEIRLNRFRTVSIVSRRVRFIIHRLRTAARCETRRILVHKLHRATPPRVFRFNKWPEANCFMLDKADAPCGIDASLGKSCRRNLHGTRWKKRKWTQLLLATTTFVSLDDVVLVRAKQYTCTLLEESCGRNLQPVGKEKGRLATLLQRQSSVSRVLFIFN